MSSRTSSRFLNLLHDLSIETIHRGSNPVLQPALHRVGGSRDGVFHAHPLFLRERREHVIAQLLLTLRRSDTDAKPRELRRAEDRKSTRLNSSHSSISYAVFCLKK